MRLPEVEECRVSYPERGRRPRARPCERRMAAQVRRVEGARDHPLHRRDAVGAPPVRRERRVADHHAALA
eukprot:3531981-Prymnesium_polylepis.1